MFSSGERVEGIANTKKMACREPSISAFFPNTALPAMSTPDTFHLYVLDLNSGTYFAVDRSVIIDARVLTDEQLEILAGDSDFERVNLGKEVGRKLQDQLKTTTPQIN